MRYAMLARLPSLRHLPPGTALAALVSAMGATLEFTYHFIPATAFPPFGQWVNGLSARDLYVYQNLFELSAHIMVALGVTTIACLFVYRVLQEEDRKSEAQREASANVKRET